MTNFIPITDCLTIDLRNITDEKSIVALHETGHLIVMYALGLMKYFNGIDIIKRDGKLGLTDMTPDFNLETQDYAINLVNFAGNYNESGDNLNDYINAQYIQGPKFYFPHICRLFAGGSITRHYGILAEERCALDLKQISDILKQYQLENHIKELQNLVDAFLSNIFNFYDSLIKAIYKNLIENVQLSVDDVNHIIEEWKSSYPS